MSYCPEHGNEMSCRNPEAYDGLVYDCLYGHTLVYQDGAYVDSTHPDAYIPEDTQKIPCLCEAFGEHWNSGVPGVLARVIGGRIVAGTTVERCDTCMRYGSDEEAERALYVAGVLPATRIDAPPRRQDKDSQPHTQATEAQAASTIVRPVCLCCQENRCADCWPKYDHTQASQMPTTEHRHNDLYAPPPTEPCPNCADGCVAEQVCFGCSSTLCYSCWDEHNNDTPCHVPDSRRRTMNKQEAVRHVAQVAMADLLGCSAPPEGIEDNYPFNAVAWRKSLPQEWQAEAEEALRYVYHNEKMP